MKKNLESDTPITQPVNHNSNGDAGKVVQKETKLCRDCFYIEPEGYCGIARYKIAQGEMYFCYINGIYTRDINREERPLEESKCQYQRTLGECGIDARNFYAKSKRYSPPPPPPPEPPKPFLQKLFGGGK